MKKENTKYEEFKQSYASSGMTQKEYSKHRGISPSMVSYYLRKAREAKTSIDNRRHDLPKFQHLELLKESASTLRIDLPQGIVLTLNL